MNKPQIGPTHQPPKPIQLKLGEQPKVIWKYEGVSVTGQRFRVMHTTEIAIKWKQLKFTMLPAEFHKVKFDFENWFPQLVAECRKQKPDFCK